MDFDVEVKTALYRATADTGMPPGADALAARIGAPRDDVRAAYLRLAGKRLLLLEPDGRTIRMAPPFSGVPTEHLVRANGIGYFANCAWDSLGIPAALKCAAEVESRCGQTLEPLRLSVGTDGPPPSPWLFHCAVPAARWWQDLVYT